MAKLIFPGISYLLCLNVDQVGLAALEPLAEKRGFRVVNTNDLPEFLTCLKKVRHLVGAFVDVANFTSEDQLDEIIQLAGNKENRVKIFNFPCATVDGPEYSHRQLGPIEGITSWQEAFGKHLRSILPPNLEELTLFCGNFIVGQFFPEEKPEFEISEGEVISHDCFVTCQMMKGAFVCYAEFSFTMPAIRALNKDFENLSDSKIVDCCNELVNQFLGTVSSNIAKVQEPPRIGLPNFCESKSGGLASNRPTVFVPTCVLQTLDSSIALRFGMINIDFEELPDLTKVELSRPSDEIDFF